MKNTYIIFAIVLLVCMSACQTSEKIRTKRLASYGPPYDVEWHKEVRKYENEFKKDYFEDVTYEDIVGNWNRDVSMSELGITEKNYGMRKLESIPIENYVIIYENLKNWTPAKPIEELMELDKNLIKNVLSINNIFIKAVNYSGQDRNYVGSQPILRLGSDYLTDAYYVKKLPIISITVAKSRATTDDLGASENLFVYKEDGVYKCICNNQFFLVTDFLQKLLNTPDRNMKFSR